MTKIGVVGGGNMGAGIAQKYATEGMDVVVVDVDQAAADKARDRVKTTLGEGVARKIFTQEDADKILARMTFSGDRDALKGAALVVEAVFEDKKVKQDLFKDLDARLGKDTILATNTSSFYVDDVAEVCTHKDRVLGLHYFYHPAKNRLVEVIAGKHTSPEAFARAWTIQEQTKKIPIESKDAPGFIVNRFFVPWLNEALRIVDENVCNIATVERAAKNAFGVGMGPFELMNVTGPPITLHAATTLGKQISKFYEPCGFIKPIVDKKALWDLKGDVDDGKLALVGDRLFAVVAQIACALVDEKVCTLEDVDLGARVGLRWPKGPFEMMNERGTRATLEMVRALVAKHGDLKMPASLSLAGEKDAPFEIKLVSTRVDKDGVGTITFQRPDAMNALNEAVVAQLAQCFDRLDKDAAVKGIVIEGKGKAFVAGADTKFFVEQIEKKDVPRIVKFAADGQKLFARIDACKKPVVCKLHGLSLGGGSELALACDYIVATPAGSLGFPETGIGIYAGLGGTQRSARRVGVPLARWLMLTGEVLDARTAQAMGLVDDVVDAGELDAACRKRALGGATRDGDKPPPSSPQKGFEGAWATFTFSSAFDLLKGNVTGGDDKLRKSLKKATFKAPLASAAADRLVKMASSSSLAEGLAAETAGLQAIFSSKDAYEGLSSLGVRRPSFKGA